MPFSITNSNFIKVKKKVNYIRNRSNDVIPAPGCIGTFTVDIEIIRKINYHE